MIGRGILAGGSDNTMLVHNGPDWFVKPRTNEAVDEAGGGAAPKGVPQTIEDVNLKGRIQASGMEPAQAGKFFGWKRNTVIKGAADFTKEQLLANGWTKERLLHVAQGYEDVARITPNNPSAAGRAQQLREIAKLFD